MSTNELENTFIFIILGDEANKAVENSTILPTNNSRNETPGNSTDGRTSNSKNENESFQQQFSNLNKRSFI